MDEREPDLASPIQDGLKSTWGDKKRFCEMEAEAAVEGGFGPEVNPYIVGSWPWRWWNQFFLELLHDGTIH